MNITIVLIDSDDSYREALLNIIKKKIPEAQAHSLCFSDTLEEMLTQIRKKSPNLIFINCTYNSCGVELLKHIRLTRSLENTRNIPIVLYSLTSKDRLLWSNSENEINAMIVSKGCYIFNIFELNKAISKVFECYNESDGNNVNSYWYLIGDQLIEPIHNLNTIKHYVKLDTNTANRHAVANLWGPHRLLRGYRLAVGGSDDNDIRKLNNNNEKELLVKKLMFLMENHKKAKGEQSDKTLVHIKGCKELAESLEKVLYVDDEADDGEWADTLCTVLFHGYQFTKKCCSVKGRNVFCDRNNKERLVYYTRFDKAEEEVGKVGEYSLVLLDLRGKGEDVDVHKSEELSGVKLLKKIKCPGNGDPSIPIIIFTASNKQWNYDHVLAMGADGYWVKESPEFGANDNYSLENFARLIKQIETLLGKKHLRNIWQCVKKCTRLIKQIETLLRKKHHRNICQCVKKCTCTTIMKAEEKAEAEAVRTLLKTAFFHLQYNDRIPFDRIDQKLDSPQKKNPQWLASAMILLGISWEKLRGSNSKLASVKDPNIIDCFLFRLRGHYAHAGDFADLHNIKDVEIYFTWFAKLVENNNDNCNKKFCMACHEDGSELKSLYLLWVEKHPYKDKNGSPTKKGTINCSKSQQTNLHSQYKDKDGTVTKRDWIACSKSRGHPLFIYAEFWNSLSECFKKYSNGGVQQPDCKVVRERVAELIDNHNKNCKCNKKYKFDNEDIVYSAF